MQTDSLFVGPNSCAFRAIDILDYFVFNAGEYVFVVLVSLLADLNPDTDEERAFLFIRLANH